MTSVTRSFVNEFRANFQRRLNMPECTCFPSPPGGITRCESGQTAICGYDELGRCDGRCVTIASDLAPLDYAAQLLSEIVAESVSTDNLEQDAKNCAVIINLL